MNNISELDRYRLNANRLRKKVSSLTHDHDDIRAILLRFQNADLLGRDKTSHSLRGFTLQNYLQLLAIEAGYSSWNTLQQELSAGRSDDDIAATELYRPGISEFNLNIWCASYEQAKDYQRTHKGLFLLQYKGKSFLAQAPHIIGIGLDPNDPDWEKIDWDWVKPADDAAKARLRKKLHSDQCAMDKQ